MVYTIGGREMHITAHYSKLTFLGNIFYSIKLWVNYGEHFISIDCTLVTYTQLIPHLHSRIIVEHN